MFVLLLKAGQLPGVPTDRQEVLAKAEDVARRVPEAQRGPLEQALAEAESRGLAHPGELGDLGPDPARCGELGRSLRQVYELLARLDALREYADAWRAVHEEVAVGYVTDAYEQATMRIERGRLPAESYVHARRFVEAHGEAVARGRTRAKRARATVRAAVDTVAKPAAPANDTREVKKTGTGEG